MAILPRHRAERLPREVRPFDRILCAVDGSRGSAEAVREALALAPCTARMCFIAVTDVSADANGRPRVASLAAHRARQALQAAQATAGARALATETALASAPDVATELIVRARPGDRDTLLVVGSHGDGGPADGATAGSVATALVAHAEGALLVARAGARADAAGPRILVAMDDSPAAGPLARLAGAIAAGCDGYVHLVHVQEGDYGSQTRHRLAELSTALIEQTGSEPVVEVACAANIAAHVCQLAADSESSLVVVGRRARPGSVGERIAHAAPCSVLVAPAR